MTTACAVIGAQYGDEGKGLMTDYLAHTYGGADVVVVRSNGGAQAAHTVVTPDGARHVFSHHGSGTFAGARTHLSRFMICDPIRFLMERQALIDIQCVNPPPVSVDPDAMVSIPFDALINQATETFRNKNRHGSCGLGIGETVERTELGGFPVRIRDLAHLTIERLRDIRKRWVYRRLHKLGVLTQDLGAAPWLARDIPEPYGALIEDDTILEHYLDDCRAFLDIVEIVSDRDILTMGMPVFEAAQGLGLDQTIGHFPYVTRSNTGLPNIIALCESAGITVLQVFYMTRCYTTRHGAGPLDHETRWSPRDIDLNDPTNKPNPWQGSLRAAPLDFTNLKSNIDRDLASIEGTKVEIIPALGVTCLDQVTGKLPLLHRYLDGTYFDVTEEAQNAHRYFNAVFPGWPVIESWGPTRETIHWASAKNIAA